MDIKTYKQALLDELYKPYKALTTCPLKTFGCTKLVFGEGNPDADIMFIGEAPGRNEDAQGRPFVGRSGKLLTQCLLEIGLNRNDVYITNIVKCRPPDNRKPLPHEVSYFKKLLMHEIKIIRPVIICTVGASALESLVEEPFSITQVRGKPLSFHKPGFEGLIIMPTFHPAYILRNNNALPQFKKDLLEVSKLCVHHKNKD